MGAGRWGRIGTKWMRVPEEGLVRVSGCRTFGRVVFRRMSLGQDWLGVQSKGERGFWRQSPSSGHKAYGVTSAPTSLLPSDTMFTGILFYVSDTETGVLVSWRSKKCCSDTETCDLVSGWSKKCCSDTGTGDLVSWRSKKCCSDTETAFWCR